MSLSPVNNAAPASLILNVDDNDAARYAKTRILIRAGHHVIEAASGEEAMSKALSEQPLVMLLDVKLPDINGMEVCSRLKSNPATSSILILQTSASYLDVADKIRALDGGADNYLFEPIEPEELAASVNALLRLARVESELRNVDRRKNEFLAVLAHELRNPLAPIRNAVELLQQKDPDAPAWQLKARGTITRHLDHMVRLVNDLLDVARLSHSKLSLQLRPVELRSFVDSALESSNHLLSLRRHTLTVNLPQQAVWVMGDEVRLAQVIGNLLLNAAKFTEPGGRIELSASSDGESLLIAVTDNGIGLAPDRLQDIFHMFEQARDPAGGMHDGLGIGLALVKNLAEMHQGSVHAHSAGPGQGSRFELRLPLTQVAADTRIMNEVADEHRKKRILIVDDNVDSADTLSDILETFGHEVKAVYSGGAALSEAPLYQPDAVFLDIGLGDMTGFDAAIALRKLAGLERTFLIAFSGYGDELHRSKAVDAGFDDYLVKPMDFSKLAAMSFARKA
jgi:signal transduction histidine kinase